jgi:DNA-binding response OmpR family regulator
VTARFLIVDDDASVRRCVAQILQAEGAHTYEAGDVRTAFDLARRVLPHLVLLDLWMPGEDGLSLPAWRQRDPVLKHTPVCAMIGDGRADMVRHVADLGIRDYILKPFGAETLLSKVRRYVDLSGGAPAGASSPSRVIVVDAHPAVRDGLRGGLGAFGWGVEGFADVAEAWEYLRRNGADAVLVSASLPNGDAEFLKNLLRADLRLSRCPILAMCVRGEEPKHRSGERSGFDGVIAKPIDIPALDARLLRLTGRDPAARLFRVDEGIEVVEIPDGLCESLAAAIEQRARERFRAAADRNGDAVLLNLLQVRRVCGVLVRLVARLAAMAREQGLRIRAAASPTVERDLGMVRETRGVAMDRSMEEARIYLAMERRDGFP